MKILENDILIVKCDTCLPDKKIKELRKDIEEQLESGFVMLPAYCTFDIMQKNRLLIEQEDGE